MGDSSQGQGSAGRKETPNEPIILTCSECTARYDTATILRNHMMSVHNMGSEEICSKWAEILRRARMQLEGAHNVTVTPRSADHVVTSGPIIPLPTRRSGNRNQFDDLSASSSSSSSQQHQNAQIPGPSNPVLSSFQQQAMNMNQPHESSLPFFLQLQNSIQQFLANGLSVVPIASRQNIDVAQNWAIQPAPMFSQQQIQQFLESNMSGLLNAPQQAPSIQQPLDSNTPGSSNEPQQAPWIQQPLGLNIPGPSNTPQQPIDIIKALLSNRNNLTTTQLESIIQQLFASNIPGLPNAPQQAPWIQQPLGLNIPGPSNAHQQSTGISQALEMIQQQNIAGAPPPGSHSLPVFMRIPHPVAYEISRFQQLSAPNTQGVANPPQQSSNIAQLAGLNQPEYVNPYARAMADMIFGTALSTNTGNVTAVSPGDTEVNDPSASTFQQRIDEPNVPGTSPGQEAPERKVFKPYQPHRGPNL